MPAENGAKLTPAVKEVAMPEIPAWLESLVEAVVGGMTAQGLPGPLGLRYLGQKSLCDRRQLFFPFSDN